MCQVSCQSDEIVSKVEGEGVLKCSSNYFFLEASRVKNKCNLGRRAREGGGGGGGGAQFRVIIWGDNFYQSLDFYFACSI